MLPSARPRYDAIAPWAASSTTSQVVVRGDLHDRVHLAGHAGIVNGDDGLGSRGDGVYDASFINVERVGPNIDKDWHTTAQHEGVGGRDKGV